MISTQEYIQNHQALFWSVPKEKKHEISEILLVETILNYGTWEDVLELFEVLKIEKVAQIFGFSTQNRPRHNYLPQVENYFRLYFAHHVH